MPLQHPSLQGLAPVQPDLMSLIRWIQSGAMHPGLTGLDPKFFQDPRFDYVSKLGPSREPENKGWAVMMGNPLRDDYDSAPVWAKSKLAVDEPAKAIRSDMEGKSVGPSDWFTQNTRSISGGRPITDAMAEEMRRRMLQTRDRIEDRY